MPLAPAPPDSHPALGSFSTITKEWFEERFGQPTHVQNLVWPRVAAGEHVLAAAPTGSGKTLAAFLWGIDRLLSGAWEGGLVRVLYISPLKALNNDIEKNLLGPLAELERAFAAAGKEAEPVRVGVRSGDTTAAERSKMLRTPPEILITTPESLNILLTSPRGKGLFTGLQTVILDEIHAVAASKRGTHLITAVDRLVDLAGEFQRVALSATVKPLAEIARFVGGYRLDYSGGEPVFTPRRVATLQAEPDKRYDLRVCLPEALDSEPSAGNSLLPEEASANRFEALAASLVLAIEENRSTLLFANSRRMTEKVTRLLNESARPGKNTELAYSHHGSLSRELRAVVEQRLKEGRLRAIVATNSLELGIDIGSLDQVLLIQTPPTIASAVQRVGRSGHAVGRTAKARLYPFQGRDLVQSAVVARCVLEHDIEEVDPIRCPLDVLAQVLLSMTAGRTWGVDQLFDRIRTSYPYRDLSRRQYDLVVEMLAGRYADSRVRELEPRVAFDRLEGTLRARRGVERILYMAGGTIPDRGYFQLRHHESLAKLGELDEEFVWERSLGDTFTLGAQSWRIRQITHSDVLVSPSRKGSSFAPFWRADERSRSFHLSERMGSFLEAADATLATKDGVDDLRAELIDRHAMEPGAAAELIEFLESQRSATGSLPHRHRLLAEKLTDEGLESGRRTWILHTGWGGRVNRPLALVLPVAYRELSGASLEVDANNDSLLITAGENLRLAELLAYLASQPLEQLLKQSLESTGLFGARFRESAGRALLQPRSNLKRRVPLWLQRERAKKLLATVSHYGDFPIVVETWRTCLEDMFDLDALKELLHEVDRGEIHFDEVLTSTASPFAADLMWRTTNRLMYEDDSSKRRGGGALKESVLREVVFSAELRPRFSGAILSEFQAKLHRTHVGYPPRDAVELVEWVKERALVPEDEWLALLAAVERDAANRGGRADEPDFRTVVETAKKKLVLSRWGQPAVCAQERMGELVAVLGQPRDVRPLAAGTGAVDGNFDDSDRSAQSQSAVDIDRLLGEWVRFYGPIRERAVRDTLGISEEDFKAVAERLVEQGLLVVDRFRKSTEEIELCDAENLERLLRIQRARSRPRLEARPVTELPVLLAERQGLIERGGDPRDLKTTLDRLIGYPAAAKLWESEILPARLDPYYSAWLDSLFQETEILWLGCGPEKLCFAFPEEVGLFSSLGRERDEPTTEPLLPNPLGRFRFEEIARHDGETLRATAERIWQGAWDGKLSNTTFAAVRQGIASRFTFDASKAGSQPKPVSLLEHPSDRDRISRQARPSRRRSSERWRAKTFYSGDWFAIEHGGMESSQMSGSGDALDQLESDKDRVRLLLDRYGIVFRELLAREARSFSWSKLFRTLRLMELSGEVVGGQFFEGIHGLQFASHDAVRVLRDGLPADPIYWMCAADPASPAGLGLEGLKGTLPSRLPSNHLVFHGSRQVVVSRGNASRLEILVGPDHPDLERYLAFVKNCLVRQCDPLRVIDLAEINGQPAAASDYAPVFRRLFQTTREGKKLRLRRRYAVRGEGG